MLELKLIAMVDKNRETVRSFDYNHHTLKSHPLFQEFHEIYIDLVY